jgi:hypothetical protein
MDICRQRRLSIYKYSGPPSIYLKSPIRTGDSATGIFPWIEVVEVLERFSRLELGLLLP